MILILAISPIQWSYAYANSYPAQLMQLNQLESHDQHCNSASMQKEKNICPMNHHKDCCNSSFCLLHTHFPTLQVNTIPDLNNVTGGYSQFLSYVENLDHFYPERLNRPPQA
jgi:hypothetical protein